MYTSTSIDLKELSSFNYVFWAISGKQAGREYFITMCPLHIIPKLFIFNEEELPPEFRVQRILNKSRIPQLVQYIIENPKEYVFSSITVSVDSKIEFKPIVETDTNKVGLLIIPMNARFIINDGQHRRAAIEEALKIKPELCNETISVVIFLDAGLKRCQQMFADLNKHAVRPSKSIGILYDHRDNLAKLAIKLSQVVPIFKNRIEMEKTTISNRSLKLFTLSNLYQSIKILLGKRDGKSKIKEEEERVCIEYWTEVTKYIYEWNLLIENKVTPAELRKNYIHAHGIALVALAISGHDLIARYPSNWKERLQNLRNIDWSRSNRDLWEGRAMIGGRINKSQNNVILTSNVIKRALGLELSPKEKNLENSIKVK